MDRFLAKKTFLRGIDTTLPTPKNGEKIRSRSKPVETSCLKPPSRYQNFLIKTSELHSSSAYCTRSNRPFTTLPSNTDRFANFLTVKYGTA